MLVYQVYTNNTYCYLLYTCIYFVAFTMEIIKKTQSSVHFKYFLTDVILMNKNTPGSYNLCSALELCQKRC